MIRFTDDSQVCEMKPVISSYLKEATGYAEIVVEPPKGNSGIDLPIELAEELTSGPELADGSHSVTPVRPGSYVIDLNLRRNPKPEYHRHKSQTQDSCMERCNGTLRSASLNL